MLIGLVLLAELLVGLGLAGLASMWPDSDAVDGSAAGIAAVALALTVPALWTVVRGLAAWRGPRITQRVLLGAGGVAQAGLAFRATQAIGVEMAAFLGLSAAALLWLAFARRTPAAA